MVHNSLQAGARQSFRAVPTAFKADDVTVSPLSHNTSSAIGSLVINIVWYLCHTICTYRDIETFMTIKKQNTSKKGRIVRNGLKPLILLAKLPYFLLTFSTFMHNTRARIVYFELLKSFHMLYRGWVMCIWEKKTKIGWLHSIANTIHI